MATVEASGRLSFKRLGLAVAVVALCLAGGAALGLYCDSLNRAYREKRDLAATPAPPASPEASPSASLTITMTPEQRAAVNGAVLRGVRFLKATQMANGVWPGGSPHGYAALPALTLLECGVPPSDPCVQKAAAFLRANTAHLGATYELSLAILFLDRLGERRDEDLIRTLAVRLVAGQTATGGWGYGCPVLSPAAHKQLLVRLQDNEAKPEGRLGKLTGSLLPEVVNLPIVQDLGALKPESFRHFHGDNSNTQFGILALWVARRHEVPLERTAFLVVQRYRNSQTPEGVYQYNPGQLISPATTCAGLLGLAIGQGVALEKGGTTVRPEDDANVKKALASLGPSVGQPTGAKPGQPIPMANLYFLWSLERVAVLYDLKAIEGKDWYGWAREVLLANQQPRGNWQGGGYPGSTPTIDTCFALLTLLQANLARDLTTKMQLLGAR
jgi:hypothetical protein